MSPETTARPPGLLPFAEDEERWRAVLTKDPEADGRFVYAVKTTGVYCRPVCPSRAARRENVRFYDNGREAERKGFRPCRRCRPNDEGLVERHARAVVLACRLIDEAEAPPSLAALAEAVGLSRHHFHRVFQAQTGVTPRRYAEAVRAERLRDELSSRPTTTEAFSAGGLFL